MEPSSIGWYKNEGSMKSYEEFLNFRLEFHKREEFYAQSDGSWYNINEVVYQFTLKNGVLPTIAALLIWI